MKYQNAVVISKLKLLFLAQMNREEKRQLVIKLWKEGKTMREIAKQAHMSFGDIGRIIKKFNEESEPKSTKISLDSQALKLFRKGKNPVDVAILLDLSPSKAEDIYKEFWKLRSLYKLYDLYQIVKTDTSLLVKFHDIVKKYDLDKKDIINIVNFADKYIFLKEEIDELEIQFDNLLKQRHDTNDSLQSARKELERIRDEIDTFNQISDQKKVQMEDLNSEIEKLEKCILELKDNDEYYSKFEKFAEEKLDSIMKERRWILSLAVDAVIESLQFNSEHETLFDGLTLQKLMQDKHLDLCEQLFEKLLKQLMDSVLPPVTDQVISPVKTENHQPAY